MNTQTIRSTSGNEIINDVIEDEYLSRVGNRDAITGINQDTNPGTDQISDDLSGNTRQSSRIVKLVPPSRNFTMLQQWEGRVISVSQDSFAAIISNRTNPENPQEEVEIELIEIPHDDVNLIRPGAFFYWSVGYEDGSGIPRQRVSRVRFRRLPSWTKREINQARNKAKLFSNLFK